MYYVYIITSISQANRTYVGYTTEVEKRLEKHNSGGSVYTANYRPWQLIAYTAFKDQKTAKLFEKYLKSATGKAFLSKHILRR